MFSSRSQFYEYTNTWSETLCGLRAAGAPVVDLTISNPTTAGLFDDTTWTDLLIQPQGALYEPEPFGLEAARTAVAQTYRAKGYSVGAEQVVLCASTSDAYSYLFKLLADPGDSIAFPRPSYPLLEHLAALEAVNLVNYGICYDGAYYIDINSVRAAARAGCKAIVLVSPNNPTGSCTTLDDLNVLSELGVPIISDEVFGDYPLQRQSAIPSVLGVQTNLVFSLGGLSKCAGLPQVKVAWIVVAGPSKVRQAALARLELIGDTFLSTSTPAQLALPALLDVGELRRTTIQRRIMRNYERLSRCLGKTPVSVRTSQGGWTTVLHLPNISCDDWALRLLVQAHLVVQPGWFYDDPQTGIIVVSLLTPEAQFDEGIERILTEVARQV